MIDVQSGIKLTESEIISQVLEGNTALYELLIRRNNPVLYKVGRSYGFAHEDVEDLMQEAFIKAYVNLPKFELRASFKTWIIKIMLGQCYHKKQKLSYKNTVLADFELKDTAMPIFSGNYTDAAKTTISRELNHVIENAINNIPEDYRMVFSLREMNGLSVAETAEALEISEANVKVRLNRAKNMLRKEIEKIYSAEEIFEFNLICCDGIVNRVMSRIAEIG